MDYPLLIDIFSVVLLVVASAFFSISETALTAVSRAKIHKLKTGGDKRALRVSRLRTDKDRLIGTLLLGNNAVNILASALATSLAIERLGDHGVVYATIIMTVVVLIFAEVLPKTYAFYNAEKVALKVARPLAFLVKVLSPITITVQYMVDICMRICGISKHGEAGAPSVDELIGAIDLHHQEGGVIKNEKDMLRSILELSEMEVREVMVHRKNIASLDIKLPPTEIITQVLDSSHTRIPLWADEPDNIVAVLHAKALLKALRTYEGDIDELDIMEVASKPWFVPETNTLSNQLYQFKDKRTHMALVVDEYGALVGLVTLEDVLEEIVGQIDDEHDNVSSVAKKLKNGSYRIKGEATIRDINRQLDWKLPDEDATTLAGLVIHAAEAIPEEGQSFEFYGFWFKVERKAENQILSILVKKNRTKKRKST